MPISITCACGNRFRAKDEYAGKKVKCPQCGKGLVIEGPRVAAYDVFLSYSSKDKSTADAACAALEAQGLRCWIAPRDILPGKEWGAAIVEGIEQSRSMVLVFSANANSSPQVVREVERAVHRGMPIIPFRIEDVPASRNMEYFISCHHWMDAFDGSLEDHVDRLAQTVQALVTSAAPAKQPAPPKPPRPAAPPRATASRPDTAGESHTGRHVLLLVLALLLGGGGAAGYYVWSNRVVPDKDQEQDKKVAQGGVPEKVVADPGTPKKAAVEPGSRDDTVPSFREDFSAVKEGELPRGWTGADAIGVRKGGDRPHLAVPDAGHHTVTLPGIPLPNDFFLECDFQLGLGPPLGLTLEGKGGGPDLALQATASAGGSTGVAAHLNVALADLEPKESTKGAEPLGRFRLRLEREGERIRIKVNGETVHARPVRGYKGFERLRMTLPGGPETKVYSLAMGQVSDPPTAKDTRVEGAAALQKGYHEDFRGTAEGYLPPGWEGDDAINVMKTGGRARLEVSAKGLHFVNLPRRAIAGNFYCECEFQLLLGPRLELTLLGKDGGRDLPVRVNASAGGSTGVAAHLNVALADLEPKESTKVVDPLGQFRLRLEREGELFRVQVNGETVVTRRLAAYQEFGGLRLGLPGEGEVKFYTIRLGTLPRGD